MPQFKLGVRERKVRVETICILRVLLMLKNLPFSFKQLQFCLKNLFRDGTKQVSRINTQIHFDSFKRKRLVS